MQTIADIFNARKDNPLYNTSYPLFPSDWIQYEVKGSLSYNAHIPISFYLHIPFCKQLCAFCEYTRTRCPNTALQRHYLNTIQNDISQFLSQYPNTILEGFDIGGGTPTALDETNFQVLMQIFTIVIIESTKTSNDFEPSIEATFQTLTETKLQSIIDAGIKRLSLGLQSNDNNVLKQNKRCETSEENMKSWLQTVHQAGIQKVNIDLMYGLEGQTMESIKQDISTILRLHPEQITLYELRTNMLADRKMPDKQTLFDLYCTYFEAFTHAGYYALFGQNTFSLSPADYGVSSYLRHRMLDAGQYKGFGISAQSMSTYGVKYNLAKNKILSKTDIEQKTYESDSYYALSPIELLHKYIAISAYYGGFSILRASQILEQDFYKYYSKEIDFCLQEHLITITQNQLRLTPKGFKYYGAVLSLFYMNRL